MVQIAVRLRNRDFISCIMQLIEVTSVRVGFVEKKKSSKPEHQVCSMLIAPESVDRPQLKREAAVKQALIASGGLDAMLETMLFLHARSDSGLCDLLCRSIMTFLGTHQDTTPFSAVQKVRHNRSITSESIRAPPYVLLTCVCSLRVAVCSRTDWFRRSAPHPWPVSVVVCRCGVPLFVRSWCRLSLCCKSTRDCCGSGLGAPITPGCVSALLPCCGACSWSCPGPPRPCGKQPASGGGPYSGIYTFLSVRAEAILP